MSKLKTRCNNVYELIVEFPFWDEYNEQLKSSIADLTNLGSGSGGSITAGKFLENFTDYPYIHLDIAGPAFLTRQLLTPAPQLILSAPPAAVLTC